MAVYLIKKILYGILVAWGVISIVFALFHVLPGDPARMMAGQRADDETLHRIREDLGLNRPMHVQYMTYLNDLSPLSIHDPAEEKYGRPRVLFRISDSRALVLKTPYLGRSFQSREKVGRVLLQALPNTFILAFTAMFFAFIVGTAAGVFVPYTFPAFLLSVLYCKSNNKLYLHLIISADHQYTLLSFRFAGTPYHLKYAPLHPRQSPT